MRLLAEQVKAGLKIVGTPTSEATDKLARSLGIRIVAPDELERIDLTIDDADEFDPDLNLIKGGGAALLREKIIAESVRSDGGDRGCGQGSEVARQVPASDRGQCIWLGAHTPPHPPSHRVTGSRRRPEPSWRMATGESLLHTDGGHLILDLACGVIPDPKALGAALDDIPGVDRTRAFHRLCRAGDRRGSRGSGVVGR